MEHQGPAGGENTPPASVPETRQDAAAAGKEQEPVPAAPAAVPVPETGEPRVDAALQRLAGLPALPVSEHAAVFGQVQAELAAVLGELEPDSAGSDG